MRLDVEVPGPEALETMQQSRMMDAWLLGKRAQPAS
jgi:hypothetical protein